MSHSLPSVTECARMYLAPPKDAYWRWSHDAGAVEWAGDGRTILLREELQAYVQHRCDGQQGLPPMEAVVLLAATLRDRDRTAAELDLQQLPSFASLNQVLRQHPAAKLRIYDRMLHRQRHNSTAFAANVLRALAAPLPNELLARRDVQRLHLGTLATEYAWMYRTFDSERLLRLVKLGAEELPDATALQPSPAAAARPVASRLDVMAKDAELQAFADLVRSAWTAFRLPRALPQSSPQPSMGGLAGLANRGDLDRLALTELAHDDDTLAIRIASKEAIYVDRVPPPSAPPSLHRRILVDTGVRMWGTPRVLATAVATALVHQIEAADERAPQVREVTCFRYEQGSLAQIDLTNRDQLIAQLRHLDTRLDCTESLPEFFQGHSASHGGGGATEELEEVVIGHRMTLHEPAVRAMLHSKGETNRFAIDVADDGHARLWQIKPRGWQLLREAVLTNPEPPPPTAPSKQHVGAIDAAQTTTGSASETTPGYWLTVEHLPAPKKTGPMTATELLVTPRSIGLTTGKGTPLGVGITTDGNAALQRMARPFRRFELLPRIAQQCDAALPPLAASKAPLFEARFRGRSATILAVWDGHRMLFSKEIADASHGATPVFAMSLSALRECIGFCFESHNTLRGALLAERLAELTEFDLWDTSS